MVDYFVKSSLLSSLVSSQYKSLIFIPLKEFKVITIEVMINVQKQVKDIMKMVEETNTMITEMEETILKASVSTIR